MTELLTDSQSILSDKSVKFNNMVYPKSGWAVFIAGGPGASKSSTIKNQLLIDAAVLDCDNILNYYVKRIKIMIDKNILSDDEENEIQNIFQSQKIDITNPQINNTLYEQINQKKSLFVKKLINFIQVHEKYLENIVIDSTGNNTQAMWSTAKILKEAGYKLSFIWVVSSIKEAINRNNKRDRRVDIDYLIEVHRNLLTILPKELESNNLEMFEEVWIVFSYDISNFSMSFNEKYANTAIKLDKVNGSFHIPIKLKRKIIVLMNS